MLGHFGHGRYCGDSSVGYLWAAIFGLKAQGRPECSKNKDRYLESLGREELKGHR